MVQILSIVKNLRCLIKNRTNQGFFSNFHGVSFGKKKISQSVYGEFIEVFSFNVM